MSKKILVIDDHPETVRLIELTLRRFGYQVVGFESGPEGLAWAAKELPDLVLLDLMMPGMDGHDVCRELRADRRLREVPIIVFTAKSEAKDKKELFDAGANDYLVKPTRPSELISRVEAILARNETRLAEIDSTFEETDEAQDQPPLPAIVVMGARGGVGATTVAVNLAASLADLGRPTTLVDLDIQQGHIALYLGVTFSLGINEWLRLPASRLSAELPDYVLQYEDMLELLPARAQPTYTASLPPSLPLSAAFAALGQRQRTLVFDMGRNRSGVVAPLLLQAQHILICMRSERTAVSAARQLVEQLSPQLPRPEALHTLMLESEHGAPLPQRAVESYLGFPLFGVLTLDSRQVLDSINRNLPLVRTQPDGAQAKRFREIAAELSGESNNAGEAWKS